MLATLIFANSNYDDYFIESGKFFGIPPILLKKVAVIESSLNQNCINYNTNKTIDYGIMQINSCHFEELKKIGVTENMIMSPRVNIFAGAYLLSKYIKKEGFNLEAIGKYHSHTPYFKQKWNAKLIEELKLEISKSSL
jgi:soluble lytic murein transglycosylase-like protein